MKDKDILDDAIGISANSLLPVDPAHMPFYRSFVQDDNIARAAVLMAWVP
jgi:hypothetical protein